MADIDNSRPKDIAYPTAEPAEMGELVIVQVGDYVVNRDGDILITTTSNAGEYPNEFLRDLNQGNFRAHFLGCRDDYLEFANQCRKATAEEISRAQSYKRGDALVSTSGQVALF